MSERPVSTFLFGTVKRTVGTNEWTLAWSGSGSTGKKHFWGCKPICIIAWCTATISARGAP